MSRSDSIARTGRAVLFSAALLTCPGAGAEPSDSLPDPVARQLRTQKIDPRDVSFYVHEVGATRPILAVNAQTARNPASAIKLLTTAAGLELLGPQFRWRTRALITGRVADGRLDGDLIIQGRGDPNFGSQDLWRLLWGVRERGIRTIAGDILLDAGHFEQPAQKRGDFDGNATSAYNALPQALSVNLQTTRVHLVKDDTGKSVHAFTDPPLANLALRNELRLVQAPCQRKYHKPALRVVETDTETVLRLTGTFADGCDESDYARLLLDPLSHTAGAVGALWRDMQGEILGTIREGSAPQDARALHAVESAALESAIRVINKTSNNLMTRTLFLTLGADQEGPPGTREKARRVLARWLANNRLDFPELFVDNGSGLSRDTRISALSLARLLAHAYDAPTMPQYLSSLSIAGVDGTMRKRLRKSAVAGRAHLKTGTLRGTTALAGYVLDHEDRRWILVSLISSPKLQAWRGKQVENSLLGWVYEKAGAGEAGDSKGERTSRRWYREDTRTAAHEAPAQ